MLNFIYSGDKDNYGCYAHVRDFVVSSRIHYDVLYFLVPLGTFCSMNEIFFLYV